MKWLIGFCVAGLGLTPLFAGEAMAAKHVLEATRQVVITSGTGDARVLLKFEDTDATSGRLVTSAFLVGRLPARVAERRFDVTVHAVETAWEGRSPTWESPWQAPGGDLGVKSPANSFREGDVVSRIRLNVTSAVREMSEGRASDYGFVVVPAAWDREGFTSDDMELLSTLTDLRLEVTTANARAGGAAGRDIVQAARGEGVVRER